MRLTILLFDGFTALDVVGGYEVLANVPGVEVEFVAATPGVIAADTRRLGLLAYRGLDEVSSTDILYVPGGPGVVAAMTDAELCSWIADAHATATWTVGICNGVGLLAAAGVLDGVSVTTNWGWRERIASYGVEVVPERFHRDGSVITGAGVSASIDAALFLAALIAGEDVARLVQLGIEYFPAPPALARASLSEVSEAEKELLLALEEGPMMERLSTATLPVIAAAR
ncbi:MAG: 4-methyl-5(B-hydroxyethyl)-thiazole [Nocardioides sp.]|jgi:transcriptional regulator GlxA family with amidase domain|uniref:DJ-1/PfpI family protein n=1 Tax=Nocardioides sp. TaxID=35761 RepID=UPI0026094754|nr:DJ-1/PfpI family protein [Nocardioides sp.]MCW2833499.1 4-methyl-5(B-hydroxyethyl)-thiazole [Nocardioides sp.]